MEGHEARLLDQGGEQRCNVARAYEDSRVGPDEFKVEQRQQTGRPVAAPQSKNCPDGGVGEGLVEGLCPSLIWPAR